MVLTVVGAIPNDTGITTLLWPMHCGKETLSGVAECFIGRVSNESGVGYDMRGTVDFSGSKSCKL